MKKFKIIRDAERQIRSCFLGLAIPHQPSLADGIYGPIRSEKILPLNKKALRNIGKAKKEKNNPRYKGGEDLMIVPVGKPGSRERVEALALQYAAVQESGEEVSPFSEG